MTDTGTCIHGTFYLRIGCPECIEAVIEAKADAEVNSEANIAKRIKEAEAKASPLHLTLVKVKYHSETTGDLSTREYTYFSVDRLSTGDIVWVPVRDTTGKAMVSAIDVPEEEVASFRDKVKIIPTSSIVEHGTAAISERGDEVFGQRIRPEQKEIQVEIDGDGNIVNIVPKTETATITLRPGEDIEVRGHFVEALKLLEYAEARVITTPEDVKLVNDDMAFISKIKKAMEGKRKLLLDPLKVQVEAIRETYDYLMLPVLGAQKIYKEKMLAYNAEQDRRRQEQEDINRKRMEAAQQEMALKGELSESVSLVEVTQEAPKTVRTDLGSMSQTDHWVYEVFDFTLLPDAYKVADTAQLNAIAKSHHDKKEVPGVRFFNKPFITSRAR